MVRDEGLTACCTSFAGFFFGSLCGRLQTVTGSNVHRTFSLPVTPSRVQVPSIICDQTKTPIFLMGVSVWCAMRDLNPHGRPLDPKSSASANSANRA